MSLLLPAAAAAAAALPAAAAAAPTPTTTTIPHPPNLYPITGPSPLATTSHFAHMQVSVDKDLRRKSLGGSATPAGGLGAYRPEVYRTDGTIITSFRTHRAQAGAGVVRRTVVVAGVTAGCGWC